MASAQYTVYLPDSNAPKYFSKNLSPIEVRDALISSGVGTGLASATITLEQNGDVIRFSRPTGGTKGL